MERKVDHNVGISRLKNWVGSMTVNNASWTVEDSGEAVSPLSEKDVLESLRLISELRTMVSEGHYDFGFDRFIEVPPAPSEDAALDDDAPSDVATAK